MSGDIKENSQGIGWKLKSERLDYFWNGIGKYPPDKGAFMKRPKRYQKTVFVCIIHVEFIIIIIIAIIIIIKYYGCFSMYILYLFQ